MSKISEAILKVSFSIGHIEKNGFNAHFKFNYQAWDDVLPAVRDACVEHGLSVVPDVDRFEIIGNKIAVCVRFHLTAGDETQAFMYLGESLNGDDKAIQKAITSATKYFFLKTFMIPIDGEIDPDSEKGTTPVTKTETAKVSNSVSDDRAQFIKDMGAKFRTFGGDKPTFDKINAELKAKNRDIYEVIQECSTLEGLQQYADGADVKK
jgi:hypothetical protein